MENDLHPPGVDVSGDSVADPEILRSAETSAEPKEEKEGRFGDINVDINKLYNVSAGSLKKGMNCLKRV